MYSMRGFCSLPTPRSIMVSLRATFMKSLSHKQNEMSEVHRTCLFDKGIDRIDMARKVNKAKDIKEGLTRTVLHQYA
jgi:hypothetical protein